MLKNIIKITLFIFLAFVGINLSNAKSWHFTEWITDIIINDDMSINVLESFTVDYIPDAGFIRRNIEIKNAKRVKNIRVYDESFAELGEDELEIQYNNDKIRIKIFIKPQKRNNKWFIEYKVCNAIELLESSNGSYARLKWNALSPERQQTIDKIEVIINLLQPIQISKLNPKLSIGMKGYESTSEDYKLSNPQTLKFWGADIGAYQNFIIQIDMPKNWFLERSKIKTYIWFLLPIAVFIGFYWKWWSAWRKPGITKRVLANYQAPEGISPSSLYALMYGKQSINSIIAVLIDLANRNYINIMGESKKDANSLYNAYSISIQGDYENKHGLREYELKLLKQIFNSESTITLDKLKKGLYSNVSRINNHIWSELIRGNYIKANPRELKRRYTILGMSFFILGLVSLLLYKPVGLSLVLTGLIVVTFGRRVFPITSKGKETRLLGLGFKKYLVNESKSNDPIDPKLFLAYLPYVVLFNLENGWIKRFAGILKKLPHWYIANGEESLYSILDFIKALKSMISERSSK